MKPVDLNPSMYIDFNKENNNIGPKLKVGFHVTISKLFWQKAMLQIGLKKFLLLQKLKILLEVFTKKNSKKQIKKCLELKK